MWGTLQPTGALKISTWITPTCVGNTIDHRVTASSTQDHPHLCGEHHLTPLLRPCRRGSPPPVWGTLPNNESEFKSDGITPTCVGNTDFSVVALIQLQDHPHLCGEHCLSVCWKSCMKGSPPPVWGTRIKARYFRLNSGITPTCVGNTQITGGDRVVARDHPHLCGEHPSITRIASPALGSPPPVWGTQ